MWERKLLRAISLNSADIRRLFRRHFSPEAVSTLTLSLRGSPQRFHNHNGFPLAKSIPTLKSDDPHLIARVKDERTTLYQEILALAKMTPPICGEDKKGQLRYEIYEVLHLHQSIGWQIPLRGFLIIERTRHVQQGEITWAENHFLCATTLPKWQAEADVVRRIVHAKWGIENNGFLDLKQNWHLTHNYHHHPIATYAALLIQFLVYNLFYAYVFLQMKTYRFYDLTIKEVICEFRFSFWSQKRWLQKEVFG